jgi:PKD repeat protein
MGIYLLPKHTDMKNFLGSIAICCMFLLNTALANTVIVKGTVNDANQKPIANKKVTITTDSLNSATGCFITHTVLTNPNGYYIDTLKCLDGDIRKLKIAVENCNGTLIIKDPNVTLNNIVESNFVICVPPPTVPNNCKAFFAINITGKSVKFKSFESIAAGPGDSIISRSWLFGDSSSILTGNRIDPSHEYAKAGTYQACLYIKTKAGCESKYCVSFNIKDNETNPTSCKAIFTTTIKDSTVYFNSEKSKGAFSGDSIINRFWYYLNGKDTIALVGNVVNPSYTYRAVPGTYKVNLIITTKSGCKSAYTDSVIIRPTNPQPIPTNCRAFFNFKQEQNQVKFNSADAMAGDGDSVINRYWIFGDGTSIQEGNRIDPPHTYARGGSYTVILYIKTKKGCESKYAVTIQIPNPKCTVQVQFSAERMGPKKVQFNSSLSAGINDSIVSRTWKFGDNTTLTGNQVKPVKEYPIQGAYTVCLKVKTANGCEAEACKPVILQDSTNLPQAPNDYISIVSINPNPVAYRMILTIWSRNNQTETQVAIYDIYGQLKRTLTKQLIQGNNVLEINTELLPKGPYYLKVSSKNGKDSRAFYKL